MNNDGEPFVCGDCFRPFGAHAAECPRIVADHLRNHLSDATGVNGRKR